MEHKNNFDLLRLFAACQVVFIHGVGDLGLPSGDAWTYWLFFLPGVPIFFVISGFLVTDSFLRSDSTIDFFWRRAVRIYPALVVNILILEFVVYLAGQLPAVNHFSRYLQILPIYAATASIGVALQAVPIPEIYNFQAGFLPFYPSGVLWTLTIELSFYLALPFLLALATRYLKLTVLLVICAAIASAILASRFTLEFTSEHWILDVLCPAYIWIFALGIVARLLWQQSRVLFEGTAVYWVSAYLVANYVAWRMNWVPFGIDFHNDASVVNIVRIIGLGGCVLSAAFTFRNAASILRKHDISYGVYLWHMLFVTLFVATGIKGHWWQWPVLLALTIATAAASWFFIERPAARHKSAWRKFRTHEAIRSA